MTWMVTGGAGYIGGHTVHRMTQAGHPVVVLDDLSTGLADRVPDGVPLVVGSVCDQSVVERTIREHGVTGVVHFAGKKSVPESVADPLLYYRENVGGMTSLLGGMVAGGVSRIVFSSTAAVYGIPDTAVVTEDTPTAPINPYGATKLVCEQLLHDAGKAHGVSWLALRFFNTVGAEHVRIADRGASNLFPLVFEAFGAGRPVLVTGGDFDTPDGSGIRDYVHVADVADAHLAAVTQLTRARVGDVYNVGTGAGHSVLEVVAALSRLVGQPVPYSIVDRRPGDPATVVAAVDRLRDELGWTAKRDFTEMISSSFAAWDALAGTGGRHG